MRKYFDFHNDAAWEALADEMAEQLVEHYNRTKDKVQQEQTPDPAAAPKPGDTPAVSGPAEGMETKEKPSDD